MTQTQETITAPDAPQYSFVVQACEEGGWFIYFPDLHGCMTQADTWEEIVPMANDALHTWLSFCDDEGDDVPQVSYDGIHVGWVK